jgi:hypothetical protein
MVSRVKKSVAKSPVASVRRKVASRCLLGVGRAEPSGGQDRSDGAGAHAVPESGEFVLDSVMAQEGFSGLGAAPACESRR